ncbi:tRNA (adenosine(37)-N6)-dimethylallyltransferase MiaA [Helicobacter sp. 11S02596-1]|nr:tRNA (adenosine(37)-N6)-dimethylallyltransferase MiaA [Helicobacter sp. 11S02596-1]
MAILGPTASGKSALALEIAEKIDAEIFSLDSLSIYQEINIAAAKPSVEELGRIKHYGINELTINEHNNAQIFKSLLETAIKQTAKKTLLIVGGSSFYLKSIIEGLSEMPMLCEKEKQSVQQRIDECLQSQNPHAFLAQIDPLYAKNIANNDTYRLQKALEIFFATATPPSVYFQNHPKKPFAYPIKIYAIAIAKEILKEKIYERTQKMLQMGLVDEIASLLKTYKRDCQPFKAIGPKECIAYLDGHMDLKELQNTICTHTTQLAKRQSTFNRTQFQDISHLSAKEIFDRVVMR